MKTVVPFKPPDTFARAGIDWTKEPTPREQALRETYLTYETSCGPDGLVAVLLLAIVARRQGRVALDLQAAADFAEVILTMRLSTHRARALEAACAYVEGAGSPWNA